MSLRATLELRGNLKVTGCDSAWRRSLPYLQVGDRPLNANELSPSRSARMIPTARLFEMYKARRPWPPDFALLSQRDKFRLERRYRRRAKLKWARPRLQKTVAIAQWSGIACE